MLAKQTSKSSTYLTLSNHPDAEVRWGSSTTRVGHGAGYPESCGFPGSDGNGARTAARNLLSTRPGVQDEGSLQKTPSNNTTTRAAAQPGGWTAPGGSITAESQHPAREKIKWHSAEASSASLGGV